MFPSGEDPKGNPEDWTREEMRRWLAAVSFTMLPRVSQEADLIYLQQRDLHPQESDTREQLLERINANLRIPRRTN